MPSWVARSSDNHSVINRIMLRFRPIAPKPVGGEAASRAAEQETANGPGRRTKRKYVRVRARKSGQRVRRKKRESSKPSPPENSGVEDETQPEKEVVTLQLLPERSESEEKSCAQKLGEAIRSMDRRNVDDVGNHEATAESSGGTVGLRRVGSVIETWIIVECVTDESGDDVGVGLGFSDKETIHRLERDTCPGFVSDWKHNVIWVNEAYKRMAAEEGAAEERGFVVWLVVKEELPRGCPSFACRVRLVQQRGQGHKWNKIVACDVWRMEFARFAWKLDVNTALSLGL